MTEPAPELEGLLSNEHAAVRALRETLLAKDLHNARCDLLGYVRKVARSGDLALIIATEKAIVEGDLARYANSKAMTRSLQAALDDIAVVEKHLVAVADKSMYRIIDGAYSRPRSRKNGLPFDEARQVLAGHHARLANMDKSRLDDDEKELVDARKAAMNAAIRRYIALQEQALGIVQQVSPVPE